MELVPIQAPFLDNADLVLAADCTAFANPDLNQFLQNNSVIIGCPKLDDQNKYFEKLKAIIENNNIKSIHVVYMEVPCCSQLLYITQKALSDTSEDIELNTSTIGINGSIKE